MGYALFPRMPASGRVSCPRRHASTFHQARSRSGVGDGKSEARPGGDQRNRPAGGHARQVRVARARFAARFRAGDDEFFRNRRPGPSATMAGGSEELFLPTAPRSNWTRREACCCWTCRVAAKASRPKPSPASSACRCCAWISACSTTSTTARPSAISARRSKPPRSCRPVCCGWMKSKRAWRWALMTTGWRGAF